VLEQVDDEAAEVLALLRQLLDERERSGGIAVDDEVTQAEQGLLLDRAEQLEDVLHADRALRGGGELVERRDRVAEAPARGAGDERQRRIRDVDPLAVCDPAQEPHELGLRMLADRFELAGWRTYFLGADVPAEEIVAAANALRPEMLVLSAATHFNRLELRDVVERIRPRLPEGLEVRVTGPAFTRSPEGWPPAEVLDPDAISGP
jgi:hypothetical protein